MNFQNIKLSTLSPGTYTIKAIFDGDDTYEAAETEFTLIIDANNEAHVVIPDSGSAEQGAKRHPSLAFAEATQTKTEVTSHKYQLQMPANPNMLDLVWSCNNSSVSIDATGKTITIPNAPATCTITASFSGNSLYYAASASYTLTIEEANSGSSTPTPTPTPSEEEEDDPRYYNIYFEEQMVAQQVNQSMVYTLQAPKTQETVSGTLPSNIRDCCYFTLDDSPTHIPISSQIAISQEGMHILTLHFTGTSDYDPYNIAYTLTVGDIQNTIEKKSLNLRFSAASYSYDGTGEARYTFSYDTQYPISQSKFSINLTDLTNSSTNPRTSSYSYTEKYVVLDTTTLVEGHEYQISIKYDGDANYKVGTATTRVLYQEQQINYLNEYLTFESLQDNNTISVNNYWGYNTNSGPENGLTLTLYWSKDKSNWNSVTISRISSQGSSSNISSTITTLNKNEKIYIKGNAPTGGQAKVDSPSPGDSYYMDYWNCFSSTQNINVKGNIMSLLYGDNFENQTALSGNFCFYGLFYNNENIIDASNLVLPSTTLVYGCYWRMFQYCTSLISAPALPATTLADSCYYLMFDGCTSLTTAPLLPATTLAGSCYQRMFYHCTSLTTVPALPATTLTEYCYASMFSGCTSLTTALAILPATTLARHCYDNMFAVCTSLVNAPELPATTLADWCYESMFVGCTSLTTAPVLPASTLVEECYFGMFKNCTSLNYVKAMFTTDISDIDFGRADYTYQWLQNVAASGTFIKNTSATWNRTDESGIPSGWTVQYASS